MKLINDRPQDRTGAAGPGFLQMAPGSLGLQANRLIIQAWDALLHLDAEHARRYLARLRQIRRDRALHRQMQAQHVALLEAGLALVADDIEGAIRLASQVSAQRQTEEMARVTSLLLRFGAWRLKDWARFEAATCICPCSLIDKRQAIPTVLALVLEAAAEMQRSRMEIAKRLAADALRFASKLHAGKSFALANAAAMMGELLYEQGEIEEAEKLLRRHLAQVSRCGGPDAVNAAYATLAQAAFGRGQFKIAALLLHELVTIGQLRQWPRLVALGHARAIALYCRLGDREFAQEALQNLRAVPGDSVPALARSEIEQLVAEGEIRLRMLVAPSYDLVVALRGRIAWHAGRGEDARSLTMSMLLVELLVLTGRDEEAELELLTCLRIGRRSGMFQLFLHGSAILREKLNAVYNGVLSTAPDQAELRPYMASMIGRKSERTVTNDASAARTQKIAITGREREILVRMGHGDSNKKIAKDLGIGPETVKSHAKRIFVKLGVTKRIEAVTCANDLSLL